MLPIHDDELGSEIARRLYDFHDIVDAVTDELHRRGAVSLRGLRAVGGKGYYGRGMSCSESGHTIQLSFLTWSWANRCSTPIWLRIWQPAPEVLAAWQRLDGTPGVACIDATTARDEYLQIGLAIPTGVEADTVVARIADVVEKAMAALPPATRQEDAEPAPEPIAAPSGRTCLTAQRTRLRTQQWLPEKNRDGLAPFACRGGWPCSRCQAATRPSNGTPEWSYPEV